MPVARAARVSDYPILQIIGMCLGLKDSVRGRRTADIAQTDKQDTTYP